MKKLYFLHIPKTAGSSVRHLLSNKFRAEEIYPNYLWRHLITESNESLRKNKLFSGHFDLSLFRFIEEKIPHITFLRRPLERLLSEYSFIREHPNNEIISKSGFIEPKTLSLPEFVVNPRIKELLSNQQCIHLGTESLYPSSQFKSDKEIYAKARETLENSMFTGITEFFTESIDLMSYTLDWAPEIDIPLVNRTQARLTSAEISKKTIEKIKDFHIYDQQIYEDSLNKFKQFHRSMLSSLLSDRGLHFAHDAIKTYLEDKSSYSSIRNHILKSLIFRLPNSCTTQFLNQDNEYLFSNPFWGSGFYAPEQNTDQRFSHFRWMSDHCKLRIVVRTLNFRGFRAHFPELAYPTALDSMKVHINGVQAKVAWKPSKEWSLCPGHYCEATTLEPIKDPIFTIDFQFSKTIIPSERNPNSNDNRKLAAAVDWIQLI